MTDDYPELTPYQYGSNDPILNIDLDGLEGVPFNALQTLDNVFIPSFIKNGSKAVVKGGASAALHVGFNVAVNGANAASHSKENGTNIFAGAWNAYKSVYSQAGNWIKNTASTLVSNAKANWASGNTIIQQFGRDAMTNPISLLDGGAEANIVKGALGIEIKTIARSEKSLLKFEVRNGSLAGKIHPKSGVSFDANGFPDFSKNLYKEGANDVMIRSTGKGN